MVSIRHALVLLLVLGTALAAFSGCGDDEEEVLGSVADGDEGELNTWIWALDDDSGVLRIYDADTGNLKTTFTGVFSATPMRQVYAGPESEPTVWMGRAGLSYGFTQGFHMHQDHAHMEIPEALGSIATGPDNVHQGVASDGEHVVYANDGDSTVTVIDVSALTTALVHHGSDHSAAIYEDGRVVTTDMNNNWVRIIDADTDDVIVELAIHTGAHGDAFHHDSETVFIATADGIEILDLDAQQLGNLIPYPTSGRVSFLYQAGNIPVAFGPHNTLGAGNSDKILLLHMSDQTAEALTVAGSELHWNITGGGFALSQDGRIVVASDLSSAEAYVITIDPASADFKNVTPLDVATAGMACAVNHNGDHIWLLDTLTGTVYCHHCDDGELHSQWQADTSTDYIFATSFDGQVIKDF